MADGLTTLPTRTDESLGRTKVDLAPPPDRTHYQWAEEYNNLADAVIDIAAEVGVHGGEDGSLNTRVKAIEDADDSIYLKADGSITLDDDLPVADGHGLAGAGDLSLSAVSDITVNAGGGKTTEIQVGGTAKLRVGSTVVALADVVPDTDGAVDLGSTSKRFGIGAMDTAYVGTLIVDGGSHDYPASDTTKAVTTTTGQTKSVFDVSVPADKKAAVMIVVEALALKTGSAADYMAYTTTVVAANSTGTPALLPDASGTVTFNQRTAVIATSKVQFSAAADTVHVQVVNDDEDPALTWFLRIRTLTGAV